MLTLTLALRLNSSSPNMTSCTYVARCIKARSDFRSYSKKHSYYVLQNETTMQMCLSLINGKSILKNTDRLFIRYDFVYHRDNGTGWNSSSTRITSRCFKRAS